MTSETSQRGLTAREVQDNPFPYYREQMSKCPVWREDDINLYVIAGHEEARAALGDLKTFSSKPAAGNRAVKPEVVMAYMKVLEEKGWMHTPILQRVDPPEHGRARKILNRVFTPAQVKAYVPEIEEITNGLVDSMLARGECEFVKEFALPLPGKFIARHLGLNDAEYPRFRRWAEAMLSLAQRNDMTVEEAIVEANIEVEEQHFVVAEFEKRRQNPGGNDLISLIVHAHGEDEEPFTTTELITLMHQLITGGFETTTGALSAAMILLLRHPDQMQMLRDDRSLMPNFIEEVLRYDAPVQGLWRSVACPVNVAGVEIPEKSAAMIRYGAANRDPRVFENPDVFDIRRPNAKNHISFGFGVHFCLGAALARQQMSSAFNILLDRVAEIELAKPLEYPMYDRSFFLRPLRELHLRVR
jgi:cytochrome P450